MTSTPMLEWEEAGVPRRARWQSAAGLPPPRRVMIVDDSLDADTAWRLACEGTALLWRGDYHNARQLRQAIARRIERGGKRKRDRTRPGEDTSRAAFDRYRLAQSQRARILGMLLIPVEAGYRVPLRRAPDVAPACEAAFGEGEDDFVMSLSELLGLLGAHQWQLKGVPVQALGASIHPHYGVFSPVRGEYLDLVAEAPLPSEALAFDIGTGTGVLAAILARRGVRRVVATDMDPRALVCARDNLQRLGLAERVEVVAADLFPPGRAPLLVCNPPWLPARPTSPLEQAVYDPDSRMLKGFLDGVREHLSPGGEAWLILSDLAEHLGLRSRETLLAMFDAAGLTVAGRLDTRPVHGRASDRDDPLHAARAAEMTSLWRLVPRD
ncbi:methyltransferase [Azoarcus taiwanensis]|uniref:Methyltransferase n=1 Tax=Azoarcus taiwanensis TaxID=666964 RepID=A0A972F9H9_9RHOO|nr:class I SAM-dependent methyltransferase [Azoarcus taiwanensis]NMG02489.1 methyltransferase [Azoarcus taiwanensis]